MCIYVNKTCKNDSKNCKANEKKQNEFLLKQK